MPRKRSKAAGKFFVGDRGFPVVGAAISYAQNLASHWDNAEDRSFYVRDALDNALYRVDLSRGIVYTREVNATA